jgi:hypothetical protein
MDISNVKGEKQYQKYSPAILMKELKVKPKYFSQIVR